MQQNASLIDNDSSFQNSVCVYIYIYIYIYDPLCENPAKVFFCDLLFSKKKNPSYVKEHSVTILPFYILILTE